MKQAIAATNAPAAIGPYSQAIRSEKLLFISGQLPIDPDTGGFNSNDIKEQTRQSLLNLRAILEAAGSSMSDILKTTVFLSDMENFTAMNQVYAEFFTEPYPARAAVEAARLPKDALVEVEAVAVIR